jgi:hypothetical protein
MKIITQGLGGNRLITQGYFSGELLIEARGCAHAVVEFAGALPVVAFASASPQTHFASASPEIEVCE